MTGDGTPPPPPPKKEKGPPKIRGGKYMGLACYAEDLREPDLIGETRVDLTEVLTKGETDGKSSHSVERLAILILEYRMVYTHAQGQVQWRSVSGINILVQRKRLTLLWPRVHN